MGIWLNTIVGSNNFENTNIQEFWDSLTEPLRNCIKKHWHHWQHTWHTTGNSICGGVSWVREVIWCSFLLGFCHWLHITDHYKVSNCSCPCHWTSSPTAPNCKSFPHWNPFVTVPKGCKQSCTTERCSEPSPTTSNFLLHISTWEDHPRVFSWKEVSRILMTFMHVSP